MDADQPMTAQCSLTTYTLMPYGGNRYHLRRVASQFVVHSFQLVDRPVAESDYREIAVNDYQPDGGLLPDAVLAHRVVDEQFWRFHSEVQPLCPQQFIDGERRDHLMGADPAAELAVKFGIGRAVVAAAFAAMPSPPSPMP